MLGPAVQGARSHLPFGPARSRQFRVLTATSPLARYRSCWCKCDHEPVGCAIRNVCARPALGSWRQRLRFGGKLQCSEALPADEKPSALTCLLLGVAGVTPRLSICPLPRGQTFSRGAWESRLTSTAVANATSLPHWRCARAVEGRLRLPRGWHRCGFRGSGRSLAVGEGAGRCHRGGTAEPSLARPSSVGAENQRVQGDAGVRREPSARADRCQERSGRQRLSSRQSWDVALPSRGPPARAFVSSPQKIFV